MNLINRSHRFPILLLLLFLLNFILIIPLKAQSVSVSKTPVLFKDFYNKNQPDSLYTLFAAETKNALPGDKTAELVTQLRTQFGNITEFKFLSEQQGINAYKGSFEKPGFSLYLNINSKEEVVGVFVRPEVQAEKPAAATDKEDNFSLKIAGGQLSGTYEFPSKEGQVPVALIIAGSGPTDRNGNSSAGLNSNAYLLLAQELKKAGIASIRYDKRGIGRSSTGQKEADLRFDDMIADAAAIVKVLKSNARFSKVFIIGHSEGALVATAVANRENVNAVVSIAGAGFPVDVVLKRQLKNGLPADKYAQASKIIDSLKAGHLIGQTIGPELSALFRKSVLPYLISWMKYSPQAEIKKLKTPALIVQGTTDLQVNEADAKALKAASPSAQLVLIKGMNHVLKEVPEDAQLNKAAYGNPNLPLHAELIPAIVKFLAN